MKKRKKKKKTAAPCVVVDLGSCTLKAGFGGISTTAATWTPDACVSTTTLPTANRATLLGDAARQQWERRNELIRPIQRGRITNLEQLTHLLSHTILNTLDVTAKSNNILFSDAPGHGYGNRGDREALTEWTFEKLGMQSCMFMPQPVLAAFATGRTTAMVVDSGYESSSVSSVVDGRIEQSKVLRVDHQSQESIMLEMLIRNERVESLDPGGGGGGGGGGRVKGMTPTVDEVGPHCRQMAEQVCYLYLGTDINKELSSAKAGRTKKKWQLPDGSWLPCSQERFLIPEVLFGGAFGNRWKSLGESGGLGGAVAHQLKECHIQRTREDLAHNILAVGGRSETENFDERLQLEIFHGLGLSTKKKSLEEDDDDDDDEHNPSETKQFRPKMAQNKARSKKKPRKFATFAGGAMLAGLENLRGMWITKEEFDELGASAVIDRR